MAENETSDYNIILCYVRKPNCVFSLFLLMDCTSNLFSQIFIGKGHLRQSCTCTHILLHYSRRYDYQTAAVWRALPGKWPRWQKCPNQGSSPWAQHSVGTRKSHWAGGPQASEILQYSWELMEGGDQAFHIGLKWHVSRSKHLLSIFHCSSLGRGEVKWILSQWSSQPLAWEGEGW